MCKILIIFKSSRAAIKADNLLKLNGLDAQVVATPNDISSECGMSIMANHDLKSDIEKVFNSEKIEFTIYDRPSST